MRNFVAKNAQTSGAGRHVSKVRDSRYPTARELYDMLDEAGVEYDFIAEFEGSRLLKVRVDEEGETDTE